MGVLPGPIQPPVLAARVPVALYFGHTRRDPRLVRQSSDTPAPAAAAATQVLAASGGKHGALSGLRRPLLQSHTHPLPDPDRMVPAHRRKGRRSRWGPWGTASTAPAGFPARGVQQRPGQDPAQHSVLPPLDKARHAHSGLPRHALCQRDDVQAQLQGWKMNRAECRGRQLHQAQRSCHLTLHQLQEVGCGAHLCLLLVGRGLDNRRRGRLGRRGRAEPRRLRAQAKARAPVSILET